MTPLATLADARQYVGVRADNTADDALLTRLIAAASGAVASYTGRTALAEASVTETRDGHGGALLLLREYPVTAVTSLTVDGRAIAARAAGGGSGYVVTPDGVALVGHAFPRGVGNVVVSYAAGYTDVPPELTQAALDIVALLYKGKENVGVQSRSINGQTVVYVQGPLPAAVRQLLNPYRRVAPY